MTTEALFAHSSTTTARSQSRAAFWSGLLLALAFGLALGLWISLPLFSGRGFVPDDARAFVFWMSRWSDPGLFPNDPIADYFQAVSPRIFTLIYRIGFEAGLPPVEVNRLLPLILTAAATIFLYLLTFQIWPSPVAAVLTTAFVNLQLWMKDDLTSGTPRAFFVPLTAMFLYGLVTRNAALAALAAALMAGIYPAALLVALASTVIWMAAILWRQRPDRQDWTVALSALLAGGAALVPFALAINEWGPAVSAEIARSWPEFQAWGRTRFFSEDLWVYWICSPRSGLEPVEWCRYLNEEETRASFEIGSLLLLATTLTVPFVIPLLRGQRQRSDIRQNALLPAFLLGSLACYALAHALLFELHLPSRYIQHSLRMVAGIGFGISVAAIIAACAGGPAPEPRHRRMVILALPFAVFLPLAILTAPLFGKDVLFNVKYRSPEPQELYDYIALQPRDVVIASDTRQADDIPLRTGRSVLFSHKHSIPYHPNYYEPMRDAIIAFLRALYAPDLKQMQHFVAGHRVSHLILHRAAFTPAYIRSIWWSRQFPDEAERAIRALDRGLPAVARQAGRCVRASYGELLVIGAQCLLRLDRED